MSPALNIISTTTMSMATKLGRVVVTYDEGLPPIKSHAPLVMWSYEITGQTKTIISTTTVPVATKCGWVVTYLEGLQIIKSFSVLIKWSCKVT